MRNSIRSRLVFSYVLTTVLSVAVMGGLGLSLVSQLGKLREQRLLGLSAQAIAEQAEPWIRETGSPVALGELAEGAAFLLDARVRILGAEATVLADAAVMGDGAQIVWQRRDEAAPASAGGIAQDLWVTTRDSGLELSESQGRALTFALRRGEPSSSAGSIRLERLPDAPRPGSALDRKLDVGPPIAEIEITRSVPAKTLFEVEQLASVLSVVVPDEPRPAADQRFEGHLAHFLAGDPSGLEPSRSPRVVRVAIGRPDAPEGFVEISQAPDISGANLGATTRAFGIAALGASLLSALVGLLMSRGLSAPLAELDSAATRMGAGDLAARAPVGRQDEIGRLAQRFNSMADGLEASFAEIEAERDALRRFVADASHELRTPITALGNYNSLLQSTEPSDAAAREDFLAEQSQLIERLTWITQNLLDLSRLDAGLVELDRQPCTAASLFDAALSALGPHAESRRKDLELRQDGLSHALECDPERVTIALGNLIDNAIKFSPQGSTIRLGVAPPARRDEASGPAGLIFEVEDGGPGIDEADAERIFERFHRGRRTAAIAGSGLGLAIVRGIAEAHGGWVRVERASSGGALLRLFLPAAERPGD